ncbi:MAG: hypothetical protein GY839_05465 [candidate division Zixibacteria bacterium]|nr:hypothetical protein [candidate division Zixibacteria bacterium]
MRPRITFIETGYKRSIRKMEIAKFHKNVVFVGMPFDNSSAAIFKGIQQACDEVGLKPIKIDNIEDSGPIPRQILEAIEKAEFLIFDLTHERPNVYYELGYAHGVGNKPEEIVLIAKAGTKLHFDISFLRVIRYKNREDLVEKLISRLHNITMTCRPKVAYPTNLLY